ncbi:glycosyltransferase family 2 protein [Mucilaginibacter pocheonensis]|uniref:Glycosyltransferase involved in cell wall biosynthesis n=1 Tax=Mucilaginibacter pocheonensis TaxID=398050 RepID=A0ABU1TBB8_9SPHI|nr:glycosyltransferase family 2 protein [Mucilaginibacter pocheonensis]MDR6942697.1 glycosyltransferase involved in cell wall biosynthesis [Mucilaginibacter pocheonensis]
MKQTLVSVALCTYNGEKYLKEQLESIINQVYENLEIIIVDDCSTDKTFSIASEYAAADPRIKCFRNESNLGFNKNFEQAINLTTGDFIAISDQDDIWLDTKIQDLLDNIKDNWMVFSNSVYINANGAEIDKKLLNNFSFENGNYKNLLLGNFVTGHTSLISRDFLKYVLPFPPTGYYDRWMGFVAIYHHKLTYLDKVLTKYRIHDQSVIQKSLQDDQESLRRLHYSLNKNMLTCCLNYKNLKDEHRKFIQDLTNEYKQIDYPYYNIKLIIILYRHYLELFPELKKRKGISRLLFVLKYTRRVRE